MTLTVGSPVPGRVVPLTEVPDPVFAEAMVGPGVAVLPVGGAVVAPVTGVIATVHPHAFVVAAESGQAVLVHLGIDTVKLQGEGFTLHVAKGAQVSAGQAVVTWDPEAVTAAGYATVCPVVALDASADSLGLVLRDGEVEAGERLFEWR